MTDRFENAVRSLLDGMHDGSSQRGARDLTISDAYSFFESNGLGPAFIDCVRSGAVSGRLLESEEQEASRARERYVDSLILVCDIFEKYSIPYLLIKHYGHLDSAPRDIDVLIDPECVMRAFNVLQKEGFEKIHFNSAESSLQFLDFLRLDIYTEVSYAHHCYIDWRTASESSRSIRFGDRDVPVPNDSIQLTIMLAHNFISHRRFTLLDALYFQQLTKSTDFELVDAISNSFGWGVARDQMLDLWRFKVEEQLINQEWASFPVSIPQGDVQPLVFSTSTAKSYDLQNRVLLKLSLVADDLVWALKRTSLYRFVKRYVWMRSMLSKPLIWLKRARGDRSVGSFDDK